MSVEKVDRYGIDLYNPSGWSRRTVADGAWLNENTIYPLSANDVFLASAIRDVSGYADSISAAADEMFDYTLNYVNSNDDYLSANIDYLSGEIVTSATNLTQHILETGEQLQGEIDTLKGASDVIDVFNTFSEFTAWSADPTYIVTDNDIIKVLNDESYSADQTYYRYSSATSAWGYFGSLDPYYSKTDINTFSASLSSTVDNKFTDISGTIDSRLSNKKDKQTSAEFTGTGSKTITKIEQNTNGVIDVTYGNISADWYASTSQPGYIANKPIIQVKTTINGGFSYDDLKQLMVGTGRSELYGRRRSNDQIEMLGVIGPYPTSADDGKFLKAVYGANDTSSATWEQVPIKVFERAITPGGTTNPNINDVSNAIAAGCHVIIRETSPGGYVRLYSLVRKNSSGTIIFVNTDEEFQQSLLTYFNGTWYVEHVNTPQIIKRLAKDDFIIDSTTPTNANGEIDLSITNGYYYDIQLSGSCIYPTINLTTPAINGGGYHNNYYTIHTILAIHGVNGVDERNYDNGFILKWLDETLTYQELEVDLSNSPLVAAYWFDVYISNVEVGTTTYSLARVSDYPCGYRWIDRYGPTIGNTNYIGLWGGKWQ